MRAALPLLIVSPASLALLVSCNSLWVDTYWRSGRYVLLAIDTKSQMSLAWDEENGTSTGLIDPTVFAVGSNDKYIVVKQHPSDALGSSTNRSITNYFVVERISSPLPNEREKGIHGPLTKVEFDKLNDCLHLPSFEKVFHDLE